jgi:hypothetical protein
MFPECSLNVQALAATGVAEEEFSECLRKAHRYLDVSQVNLQVLQVALQVLQVVFTGGFRVLDVRDQKPWSLFHNFLTLINDLNLWLATVSL